ncbi:hypothetical protein [Massilia aquatica]|uniref:Lipoprotein n=1 Tax=Massilia aquatica TaxID=2609000 RepID=A0ABX0M5Y8_9BURK|nr:hypothetical protein [Massilia aquatica]NHZ41709.1 hypothetical protein [Massilia aquatica]
MRKILFFTLFFVLPSACSSEIKRKASMRKIASITLQDLLKNPIAYDGKKISVYGHLTLEAENYALSTEGCPKKNMEPNGMIWVELAKPKKVYRSDADGKEFLSALTKYYRFHNSCTWITGVYDRTDTSHWGDFIGRIKQIVAISAGSNPK